MSDPTIPDTQDPSELDKFVELATENRRRALDRLEDPPDDMFAEEAQAYAILYLADMVAALFASMPRD